MADTSTSQPQYVFQIMLLPAEVRRRIYYFVVLEPHPIPLVPCISRGFVEAYVVERDLRSLGTCEEFRTELKKAFYSNNSFSYSAKLEECEKGTRTFLVDLTRLQKCYIVVHDMTGELNDQGDDPEYVHDVNEFHRNFVGTLLEEGHQMKYLLVECESQSDHYLSDVLGPLSILRKIPLVHFRSCDPSMHLHFRFLERLMMSDWPTTLSHRNLGDFWQSCDHADNSLKDPTEGWVVLGLDMTGTVVVKSEQQMEATAKDLYSILGMEREFIPQNKLDEMLFFDEMGSDTTQSH